MALMLRRCMNDVNTGKAAEGEGLFYDRKASRDHGLAGNNSSKRGNNEHWPVNRIREGTVIGITYFGRVVYQISCLPSICDH